MEFNLTKPTETYPFNPPIQIEGDWMLELTDLEVYNSIFNITEEINKIELHYFPVEKTSGVSYEKIRDEIEKDLDLSDFTATDLQGPIILKEYRDQVTKRMKAVGYTTIVADYIKSIFQHFESFLRTEVDLVEVDIRLVSNEYNSSFIIYELEPGISTNKDISEALFKLLQQVGDGYHNAVDIEYADIGMKTKLVVIPNIKAIRFDEKSFFSTILGFTSGWD